MLATKVEPGTMEILGIPKQQMLYECQKASYQDYTRV